MTREEAIYVLKNTAWLGSAELAGDVTEAIKMAVNALKRSETPNSSDVISRTAAKRLNDLIFDINSTEICSQIKSDNLRRWCSTIQAEMTMAMARMSCCGEE